MKKARKVFMSSNLAVEGAVGKFAGSDLLTTVSPAQRTISRTEANSGSTPLYPTSFLAAISKPIGRKQLCHELRISKHLLDMWISGERKDPIERVRDIMRVAARCYGPDLPLDIAQELVREFGGLVVMERRSK